ncbi:MarR family transcriptional regulator [Nakamurella sp. YIM 132087]|uniref:MarR family transcriptional regulator n=1 Tax=Nakamurella alba TaxID=2665158 RepID=A0A7K1FKC2_9ACTN|nr:MarR family transcriptional regulator [Nakamurella alba]MTD14520.1 MarR family transcriptional regulator [Nakamurella alba]
MTAPDRLALVDRLAGTAHRMRRASQQALSPLGLTPAQERVLRFVARRDGEARMGEIADRMGIVPRSATGLVGALEEAGLVHRSIDPANRRSILVALTDAGREVQQRMGQARSDAAAAILAPLSDAELDQLSRLLDKIAPPRSC